jgi:hypothetical protein
MPDSYNNGTHPTPAPADSGSAADGTLTLLPEIPDVGKGVPLTLAAAR